MDIPSVITLRTAFRPPSGVGVLAQHPFVAIDLETTGFSAHTHRIVEVGAVKMRPDGTILDTFSQITNPGSNVPLPAAAERIHKITAREIRSAPPLDVVLGDLVEFIGTAGLVAHNLNFERQHLSAAFERRGGRPPAWQGLCTMQTARKAVTADSYKLGHLLEILGLPGINSHRAADDAKACGMLAAFLISERNFSALQPVTAGTGSSTPEVNHGDAVALLRRDLAATIVADTTAPVETPPSPAARSTAAPSPVPFSERLREAFNGRTPTEEQARAAELYLDGGDLKLIAVAGSGKTTALKAFARLDEMLNTQRRIINLTFTASVAAEAKRSFPSNTSSMTVHALARRNLSTTKYGPLLAKCGAEFPKWPTTAEAILPRRVVVDMPDGARLFSEYKVGRYALEAVKMFCRTLDESITIDHMPEIIGIARGSDAEKQLAEAVLPCARRAWKNILDPESFAVGFQHDHYLKLYLDARPRIGRDGDALMFDEAQDAAPLAMALVQGQDHLQRTYVGDRAQAIFGFNGAVDSLQMLRADHTATLTRSFRFGDAIAAAGNVYLDLLNNPVRVHGNPVIDDVLDWTTHDVTAILSRTNGGAIAEVMSAQSAGNKVALVGDTDAALDFCAVARQLKNGQSPKAPKFSAFTTWSQLVESVEHSPDASDVATQIKLIDNNGVDKVEAALMQLVHPSRADTVLTTVHKAKGLEFDRVMIADDFEVSTEPPGSPLAPTEEELAEERRLAYVALTRAKTVLNPGLLLQPSQVPAQRSAPAGMLL